MDVGGLRVGQLLGSCHDGLGCMLVLYRLSAVGWGALCPDAFRFSCLGGCWVVVARGSSLDGLSYLEPCIGFG